MRKETSSLFRSTINAMRDSMLIRRFEHVPPDSMLKNREKGIVKMYLDSLSRDPSKKKYQLRQSSSQIQIFISDRKGDSLQAVLKPLATKIQEGNYRGGNFIFRVGPDSLSTDSIRVQFEKTLSGSNQKLPFIIEHHSFIPPPLSKGRNTRNLFRQDDNGDQANEPGAFSNTIRSEWVRFDPVHRYSVTLSGFQPVLLKEIAPQILFSIFLTLLTTGSFFIIYRSLRAQQRLMILKNDFISNVTHELKTPIATVSVALEALQNFKGIDNPKLTSEYLQIAQHELGRLALLTDKVLTTSLFDEHGIKIDLEKVDVEKVVEEIMNSMRLVFEKQNAVVSFEKTGSDFVLHGSNVHLTNVVYNLLDNALKYSPVNPSISVKLKDLGDKLLLEIRDNGIGIPSEFHQKIFEKFFRMPTGDVHNVKGYGLGLSYVQSVAKAHRGSVEVQSESGKGSTFTIQLPKIQQVRE